MASEHILLPKEKYQQMLKSIEDKTTETSDENQDDIKEQQQKETPPQEEAGQKSPNIRKKIDILFPPGLAIRKKPKKRNKKINKSWVRW